MSAIATYSIESLSGYRYPWYLPSWMRRLPLPLMEFWSFGVKEALSCAFAVSFHYAGAVKILPMGGIPRYDFILVVALAVQFAMVYCGLETKRELAAVSLFHLLGLVLEILKLLRR